MEQVYWKKKPQNVVKHMAKSFGIRIGMRRGGI